jgi:hypothetical protein
VGSIEVLKVQTVVKGKAAWTVAPRKSVETLLPRLIPVATLSCTLIATMQLSKIVPTQPIIIIYWRLFLMQ